MTQETQKQDPSVNHNGAGDQANSNQPDPVQLDPAFFACANEYLELTERQSPQLGVRPVSMAILYAAARFNAHVCLTQGAAQVSSKRKQWLDYMGNIYRRMLNEHLDSLGHERGIAVGESELADEYAAAGHQLPGKPLPTADPGK